MDLKELMKNACEELGIVLREEALHQFFRYMELLIGWNQKFNLTSITDEKEIVLKHFVDSLVPLKYMDENRKDVKIIDIGSGAGFPGIPLKIVRDDFQVTLLDSLNKKVNFLTTCIQELELTGINAYHLRAEDGARMNEHRLCYDICFSRAVARLNVLCEYCMPYIKKGGQLIAYKGFHIEQELDEAQNAIRLLGGQIDKVEKINIPQTDYGRSIIFISKISNTSPKYPRKPADINKSPII